MPCDTTLKWMPRIETENYLPKNHGWMMNASTTLLRFGYEQNTDGKQNVYHSFQLTTGAYKLCFHTEGEEGLEVGVKIQKLTGKRNTVLVTTVPVGTDAVLGFNVEDGWGEYMLTLTRPAATDQISVTNLGLYSLTDEELTGIYQPAASSANADDNAFYTLSGTKAQPTSKGIYIQNHKKVLVK